ncbi:hypothetical protein B9Z55_005622 [Caenorhabditis nigoni]|uniref:F-box domain-containing protein n=1 Tax=Caenorhabditis nigoni TaxID=1611254 RepID=A0A2G5V1P2_9PELO|nr:hypothetical protein B9Z55_005622 [Caenorhabditis nigoni]
MPISLLKLPRLVGVLVVTELEYQEIFLLSTCSSRTNILVKKANIKAPKLSFRLEECYGYNEFKIGFMIDKKIDRIWLHVTSLLHVHELALENIFTLKLGLDYEANTNFDLWSKKNGKFLHRMECANEPTAIQKALQDHINSIFHYSAASQLILSMKCDGSLPNITNVKEIEIKYNTVDAQFLANVLTTYSDPRRLYVRSRIVGDLPKESPFFQVQRIAVRSRCGPDYFHVSFLDSFSMLAFLFSFRISLVETCGWILLP